MLPPPLASARARWLLTFALALLAFGAGHAMWRAPGVFPLRSADFWASTGFVVGGWSLVAIAAFAAGRGLRLLLGAAVVAPAGVLLGVGLAGRALFPFVPARFWAGLVLMGGVWLLGFSRTLRSFRGTQRGLVWLGLLAGLPWGMVWVGAQVPPPSGTHPALRELPPPSTAPVPGEVTWRGQAVETACGRARLEVRPFLTFKDSSRDGFWPGVSPTPWEGPPPLSGPGRRAALEVHRDGDALTLDAATELPFAVHAHLNAFAEVSIEGLARPAVRFVALGSGAFEFLPFDYPHGRPAHFAYLSAAGELVVARGADAEKGPFTTLAHGAFPEPGPLTLELLDGDQAVCRVTFLDFAAQADRTLSPTAGEGVATNVVQFGLAPSGEGSAVLHLSLAETGIGAGRAAVTHAAGVYRNRVVLAPAEESRR